MRRAASLAAVALACGCGSGSGDQREVRPSRVLGGHVDAMPTATVAGWPNAEAAFCDGRVGFGRSQPVRGRTTISATRDGGRTWRRRSRLEVGAATVTCLSPREVLLSAYPPLNARRPVPALLRSRDGGGTWARVAVPVDASPPTVVGRDLFAPSESPSTWYVRRDGARRWERFTPRPDAALEAVAFVGRDIAYAITSQGSAEAPATRLLRSDDGGRSWRDIRVRIADARLVALASAGGTLWVFGGHCRASGCTPLVLRTSDDGRRWVEIRLQVPLFGAPRFTSARAGVVAGDGGVLVTSDGGVTWRWRRADRQ